MKQQFSSKILSVFLIFCATVLINITAFAQNTSSVLVSNSGSALNPIIVTANRTPTPSNDVLADYTYIGPEEIAQAAQTSLPELLQQQRGVQISSFGGAGNTTSVYLRGTGNAQSLILIDGVKIDSIGGGAIWSAIPVSLIDHIEIIYGPQSTYYGSDAMGGVIQIFTKKGGGPTQFEASAGYGGYNTSISNASITGSIDGVNPINYSIGISQEHSSGFNTVGNNNASNSSVAGSYAYPNSPTGYTRVGSTASVSQTWARGQEAGLKAFVSKNTWQYPSNDPIDADNYSPTYAGLGNTLPVIDKQVNNLSLITAYSNNQINEIWQSQVQVSSSSNTGQNLNLNSNDKLDMPSYDFLWQNNIAVGDDKLQILGERRLQYANMTNSNYGSFGSCINNCYVSQERTTDSVAGSYQLRRGNNLATIALRNDNISSYGAKTTGNIAYGYFFTPSFRGNLNYGTGFRAPSFNDLYYPGYGTANLKPESNRNIEVGAHYEKEVYAIHLVGYNNKIENFIVPVTCTYDPNTCPQGAHPANFSLVQIRGISLGLDGKLNNLTIKGSADVMSTVDQNTNLAIPNRANWVGNLYAEYQANNRINLGSNLTLTGQRWANTTNTISMPSYTLFNLYASYEFDRGWTAFARWNNVFNTQYQTSYGFNNAGSNIFAGIRYAMK